MNPIPPLKIDVSPEHSCNNWRCCFGCRCCKATEEKKYDSPESIVTTTTIDKTTHVYETHRKHHKSHTKD